MKREGRQHGVVSCYQILPAALSRRRFAKMVDSASATGLFTKVPKKPTNQSKFTGKCRKPRCNGCHIHPACKSKDKAKGTMKFRSIDSESKLAKYSSRTSATGVLAYLADEGGYNDDDYDYQGTPEENYNYAYSYDYGYGYSYDHDDDGTHDIDLRAGFGFGINIAASVATEEHENDVDVVEIDDEDDDDEDDDDDDDMSFCDVGLCWGHGDGDEYGDDGWYLVGGQMQ